MSRNNAIVIMRFRTADNRVFYFVYYADSVDEEIVFTKAEFFRITHRCLIGNVKIAKKKVIRMSKQYWCEYLAVSEVTFVDGVYTCAPYWHSNPAYGYDPEEQEDFDEVLADLLGERPVVHYEEDSDDDEFIFISDTNAWVRRV
jgi:hypothetical protein